MGLNGKLVWIEQIGQTGHFVSHIGRLGRLPHFEFVDNDNVRLDRLDNSIGQVELNLLARLLPFSLSLSTNTNYLWLKRWPCLVVRCDSLNKQTKQKKWQVLVELTVVISLSLSLIPSLSVVWWLELFRKFSSFLGLAISSNLMDHWRYYVTTHSLSPSFYLSIIIRIMNKN